MLLRKFNFANRRLGELNTVEDAIRWSLLVFCSTHIDVGRRAEIHRIPLIYLLDDWVDYPARINSRACETDFSYAYPFIKPLIYSEDALISIGAIQLIDALSLNCAEADLIAFVESNRDAKRMDTLWTLAQIGSEKSLRTIQRAIDDAKDDPNLDDEVRQFVLDSYVASELRLRERLGHE